jgi:hypothetical protein
MKPLMYVKHFRTLVKHKWYVAVECFKQKLYWQGIIHDLSKFTPSEFIESARYYCGDGSPIWKAKVEQGYSHAWLSHKGRNKHHWQYWVDFNNGAPAAVAMPEKYLIEAACDLIGASKAYKGEDYNPDEPNDYLEANIKNWIMCPLQKEKLKAILKAMTHGYVSPFYEGKPPVTLNS